MGMRIAPVMMRLIKAGTARRELWEIQKGKIPAAPQFS
jgi:hypothetical protein